MRLSGVARGNLTRSKEPIRSEQEAKDRLRRIYGSLVKPSELSILDRFASEWWAAHKAQHEEEQPNQGRASESPISVADLQNVAKLKEEILFFLDNRRHDLDALSDIVDLVNLIGGLERAKRAQAVLEQLINPHDFADESEESKVPTAAAS
jgi:hypothetical protein